METLKIRNKSGREVIVPLSLYEKNKDDWVIVDDNRDKDNNIDTTVEEVPVAKKTIKVTKEEIDLPDIDESIEELDKMKIADLRAMCVELKIDQPFGASKDALRTLIREHN